MSFRPRKKKFRQGKFSKCRKCGGRIRRHIDRCKKCGEAKAG